MASPEATPPGSSPPPLTSLKDSAQSLIETAESVLVSRLAIPSQTEESPKSGEGEETLEWHEVIELQAFSERRAWIEDKIKVSQETSILTRVAHFGTVHA